MLPHRRRRKSANHEPPETIKATWSPEQAYEHELARRLETPVAEMALSVRIINTLETKGVILASDLVQQSVDDLMGIANFGDKTLEEVFDAVEALGVHPPWVRPKKKGRR